ncbi:MAG: hypothetical protein H7258_12265 [Ferruginibacter sp.]|nr:hypothetical protein [Ferruginibacter sp.]
MLKCFAISIALMLLVTSCKKSEDSSNGPKINFIFKFDSTQARLNNLGNPSGIPPGHAAQSPVFNTMSAHYIELAQDALTAIGSGVILYRAPETTTGGANAIDFDQSAFAGNNEAFLSVPIKSMAPGSYNWLRVSLAYQNYNIKYKYNGVNLSGTIASFIGFNTYIRNYKVKDSSISVNDDRLQGYWAFETSYLGFGAVSSGQTPAGATTVPNPLQSTSPIPAGSCVVTGQFASPLTITGSETNDITIIVSLSTNKSFEWIDNDGNGTYDPVDAAGAPLDAVVDMGIRGLIPAKQ